MYNNLKREKLKKARKQKGLKQGQVSEEIGISRSFYSQIESGARNPRLEIALKISEYLEISLPEWC